MRVSSPPRLASALLVLIAALLGARDAQAQTVTQRYEFLGWTATGNEVASRVTVAAKGISAAGDPVDWSYTLLEIANARSGELLNTYRVGTPRGEPQKAWDGAKAEADGEKILGSLGLIPGVVGAASPLGGQALVTRRTTAQGDPVITAECPGCTTCESRLQLQLLHGLERKLYTVREHARSGNPYPPDDTQADCPDLRATTYWHPQGDRFAVLLDDSLRSDGTHLETLTVFYPAQDSATWAAAPLPDSPARLASERLAAQLQALKQRAADSPEPQSKAPLLALLGDLQRQAHDMTSACGYYGAALEFDKNNLRAALGRAACDLHAGKHRDATREAARLERLDRSGALAADLGLFWLSAGDTARAAKQLQRAVDGGGGADFGDRIQLGLRILDADLDAGMAYLDNLMAATPENPDERLAALLHDAWTRMAREALHSRDFTAASQAIGRLPKTSPEARQLALLYAALSPSPPDRLRSIIDKINTVLDAEPTTCSLYFARAMASRQSLQPAATIADLQATLACDPDQPEARFYLGDLLAAAGNLPAARQSFEAFLQLAPQRTGDRATRLRRDHVTHLLPRFTGDAVILLSSDCTASADALACRGVLRNNTDQPAADVHITLTATTPGKRPRVSQQAEATQPTVAPGASVDFLIRIPRPEDGDTVELTLGRDDKERDLNKSEISW